MYRHCLFCLGDFGSNQELERLPVGRRVAFDSAKGRLWVVCRACARWNLTPLEDRWETIEDCERRFRSTQVRVSTENIGLARLADGLELVRIGAPLRPEFAAWRYGQQFQRRHEQRTLRRIARGLSAPGLIAVGPVLAAIAGPIPSLLVAGAAAVGAYRIWRRPALTITRASGEQLRMSTEDVAATRLIRDDTVADGWALMVPRILPAGPRDWLARREVDIEWVVLDGREARMAATLLLPKVNPLGGDQNTVGSAVRWLEAAGGPQTAFATFARSHLVRMPLDNVESKITTLHAEVRLALEMALHEEEERRALAGELSVLEWVWRHEEMLADLADSLTVPASVESQLESMRTAR